MRYQEILKNKKKQLYIAKKAEMEAKKITPLPKVEVSDTAEKILKNIKKIKNKKLIKNLQKSIKLDELRGITRYNFLKEIKDKLDQEEREENKKNQEKFFDKLKNKKEKNKKINQPFGLLRF